MRIGKLLLTIVSAIVLLGALVSSASARNFSVSSQTNTALFTRLDFIGGFDTVECEVKISGSFHSRTQVKSVGTLVGYITEATVLRCARGGMTINQASLPWHRRYAGFTGTLPNITSQTETVSGAEWRIREPVFGITCNVGPGVTITIILTRFGLVIIRVEFGGRARCGEFEGTLRGSTSNVAATVGGARITVTLI